MNKNKVLKSSVLPLALCLTTMTFSPILVSKAIAEVQNVQQGELVKGTIVDETGEPIIGATVLVVGGSATQGTVADMDGNFSIKVKPGAKLKISYIGFADQVVPAKNGMKVTMKEGGAVNLNAVEVVAYGVQKKVTMTGAISSVKSEDLVRTSVGSVNNVLGGQLSGVTTVQYSGEPGSDAAEIFVRGKATWGDSQPLIQVDGVERTMADIDPNEIESVTVLKDASATAVFGVRGANGVVLITTKRGAQGKAKINVSTSWTALAPTKMVEQASSYEYANFYNQMSLNDYWMRANKSVAIGKYPDLDAYTAEHTFSNSFSEGIIQKFATGSDPIRFPSTKWADYIMKDVTLQQQHNLNISGGTDRVKYFISAGYYSQDGLFKEFDAGYNYGYQYHRFNYRSNLDLKATKTTTLSFNVAGNVSNADKPYTGSGAAGLIKQIYYATPFSSPGIVDNKLVYCTADYDDQKLPFVGNAGMGYYGNGFMQTNINKIQMDLVLDQKLDFITKGLSFKAKGSYNSAYTINKQGKSVVASFNPLIQYEKDDQGQFILDAEGNKKIILNADGTPYIVYRQNGNDTDPSYSASQAKARDWYLEGSFNYSRVFDKHTVNALLLYNQSKQYYYSNSSYPDVPRSYVGLVGRVTYDYASRYMAEFNMGYNGSENFAPGRRFGVFPAGSVGWILSEEKFWKPISKVASFFKIRASWGLVGNDKTKDAIRFMYLADPYITGSYGLTNNMTNWADSYGYLFGNAQSGTVQGTSSVAGAYESIKNNPDIGWEKAFKQDYGFDLYFFGDRFKTTFDYYREHRTDILVRDETVPSTIGFTMPYTNAGEAKSWGWELSLGYNDKIGKDFRFWGKLNLSYNQNEIVEMKEEPKKNEYMMARGHRIGARSMYKFWKYYEGEQTKVEYEKTFGQPFPTQLKDYLMPGDCVYIDLDGDGKINPNDKTRDNGYTDDPEYMAGLTLGFNYKRLTFNMQLTGAWNVSRYITDVFRQPFYCSSNTTQGGLLSYHVNNTWTPESYESQDALYPRATWDNAEQNYAESDLWEKDAKYLRLKTVSLSYDFINPAFKKIGMHKCEVTLSGYNLLTFTPYKWGDPETRASNAPSYPLQRTYTISLNVGF
ncbi:SusC/RagA family TonB-linked outer membrane protein [Segatella sp.]|uniref:SusC/RagA family TonB-linked outer membrane protein n=1 Tax=Segatella sp. TaxID=2974253 RepID=UPI003AAA7A67